MTDCDHQPHLHVFAERSLWRWSYHEPAGDDRDELRLRSSIAFVDAEEARSAASTAYPGVPIAADDATEPEEAADDVGPMRGHRCRRRIPAALALAALLVAAAITVRRFKPVRHRS